MSSPQVSARQTSNAAQLWIAYIAEGCASIGSQMLMVAIYFYTRRVLQWKLADNYHLAVAQGAVYVCGALLSSRATKLLGQRGLLLTLQSVLALIAVALWMSP